MQHAMLNSEEFWTAFKPVLDFLGVTPQDVYDDPGVHFQWDTNGVEVSFRKAATPGSDEPWTVVKVGMGETQEFAYDVRFHVPAEGVVARLWPDAEFREATPVRALCGDVHIHKAGS